MADLWTDEEFDRVARVANRTVKTLAACRDVLVEGMSGVNAARKHQTFAAHISRAVHALNEQKALLELSDKKSVEQLAVLKTEVGLSAKRLLGPGLLIAEAVSGNTYDGPVVAQEDRFFVQHIGRFGVIHDQENLNRPLHLNVNTVITYPLDGLKASVDEKVIIVERRKSSLER